MNEQSQQPEPIVQETKERVNCEICGSYVAKLFIDLNGRRIWICNQDAFTLLRLACKLEQPAMSKTLEFVESQVYGKEL